jgi:hypothetical protein
VVNVSLFVLQRMVRVPVMATEVIQAFGCGDIAPGGDAQRPWGSVRPSAELGIMPGTHMPFLRLNQNQVVGTASRHGLCLLHGTCF